MNVVTAETMRQWEEKGRLLTGISEEEMILTAGTNAAEAALDWEATRLPSNYTRGIHWILAGKGKNGADAWVAAAHLHQAGKQIILADFSPAGPRSSSPGENVVADIRGKAEFPIWNMEDPLLRNRLLDALEQGEGICIDGLVGIGLTGSLRPPLVSVVMALQNRRMPVISLDVPSGLQADTGNGEWVIPADLTLTMGAVKQGLLQNRGLECSGQIQVIFTGIPFPRCTPEHTPFAFGREDAARLIAPRPSLSHKNSFGKIVLLAGSRTYSGAPFLAAEAALRAGAGVTTLILPDAARKRQGPAALILQELPQAEIFEEKHWPHIAPTIVQADSILFGPGITQQVSPLFLQKLLQIEKPVILDADALRILAANPWVLPQNNTAPRIFTPHPGEMQALLQTFCPQACQCSREDQAMKLAEITNAVIVLKGFRTIVADPRLKNYSWNLSGGPALATPGTGDVLAGILTSLAAQMPAADAARLGVYLHGLAADCFEGGPQALLADDLPLLLGKAWAQFHC